MSRNLKWLMGAVFSLVLASPGHAVRKNQPEMTLEQLTKAADAVVIGRCKDKNSHWVKGHIETDYEIAVDEELKGNKRFRAGSSFRMTVMGGDTTTPPLSQFTASEPYMHVDEDVALFIKSNSNAAPGKKAYAAQMGSNLHNSPRVVGSNEGKFSIVVDSKDGRRKLTRLHLEDFGILHKDSVLERLLRAVARHEVKVTSGPVVALGGGYSTTPENLEILEKMAATRPDGQTELVSEIAKLTSSKDDETTGDNRKSVMKNLGRQRGTIPLHDLEDFKSQVKQFAN